MVILVIVLGIAAILGLAGLADCRARQRRTALGAERFTDGATDAAGATSAITRARRSAANNDGYGVPGSTLGTGE